MTEENKAAEQSAQVEYYDYKTRFFLMLDDENYVIGMVAAVTQAEADDALSQNLPEVSAETYEQVGPDSMLIDGKVVQGKPRQPVLDNSAKQAILAARMRDATVQIQILQDAVDLEMATEAEVAALTQWKKYRVLLSRVDVTTTDETAWPAKPE